MRIEVVTSGERFQALRAVWDALWTQSRSGVFQSHGWTAAWWAECARYHRLRIVCAWQSDGTLIAILPLCIRRLHGIRVLEWAAQPYSDYCDVVMPAIDERLLDRMWSAVTKMGGYDLMRLKHVRPDAAAMPLLSRIGHSAREEICLQVAREWANGEAWFKVLNKKTRNNHVRGRRILDEHGDIVFRQLDPTEPREPVVQQLIAYKRKWEGNRDSPLVRSDTVLVSLVEALHRMRRLRIFLIERAGTIIAGSINAIEGQSMLALFATYDPAYERASPGILLMTEYTKWAFDQGIEEVDYLLGAEGYKFRYANRRMKLHIVAASRTPLGWLTLQAERWIQRHQSAEPAREIGSAYLTEKGTPRKPERPAGNKTKRNESIDIRRRDAEHTNPSLEDG